MGQLPSTIKAVGGHPMCGKETAGLQASDPNLFQRQGMGTHRLWIGPTLRFFSTVQEMTTAVGAQPVLMTADDHDVVAACVSHLPYLLAATLVAVAEETAGDKPDVWRLASSGFRDTSRSQGAILTMMMDILAPIETACCRCLKKLKSVNQRVTQSNCEPGRSPPVIKLFCKYMSAECQCFKNVLP